MTITKFGHSCFLVEEGGARILVDPGKYSDGRQNSERELDSILITHEHGDHCDVDSIKALRTNNSAVPIYTNAGVGAVLTAAGIEWTELPAGKSVTITDTTVTAVEAPHAPIHPTKPVVLNVGFLINNRLFHPGDSFTLPPKPVDILMFPLLAPWSKFSEVADYLVDVKPKIAIPVHDGMLRFPWPAQDLIPGILEPIGSALKVLEIGQPTEV